MVNIMKKTMEKITLLSLSLMLTSSTSVSTVLPAMLGYFNRYPQEKVEMLITVPSFAITAMIFLNTWISKYIKEKMMITGGLLLIAASGITPVFCHEYSLILISRILLGFGIGMINARAISMISERYTGDEKTVLLGYRGSAEVLGNAVMTLVAGRLFLLKWNYVFWVYALGFGILALYWIFIPENKAEIEMNEEKKPKESLTKDNVFFIGLYTVFAGVLICISCSNSLRIPMLVLERNFGTETDASVVLSLLMITGIFSGICFGKLAAIFKEKLMVYGLCFLGAGLLVITFSGNMVFLGIGAIITGFFYTISLTCIFNGLSDRLPQETVNTATAAVLIGCNLGGACSPIILKAIGMVSSSPFATYSCMIVLMAGITLLTEKKRGVYL